MVSLFYAIGLLTLGVSGIKNQSVGLNGKKQDSVFFNLKQRSYLCLENPSFISNNVVSVSLNLTVFPVSHGILQYVAKSLSS